MLFYTGITSPFCDIEPGAPFATSDPQCIAARATKRVGIATAKSVYGPWRRYDAPILPSRPGMFDSFLTSNPAPLIRADGSELLVYKARAYKKPPYTGELHGSMTIGVAWADRYDGPYQRLDAPIFPPDMANMEDPCIWMDGEGYHMIAKDMEGNLCGEFHGGIYAHSADGLHWTIAQGTLAYSRDILWDNGVRQRMGSLERPSILLEEGRPRQINFATADGAGTFTKAENTWNVSMPLY